MIFLAETSARTLSDYILVAVIGAAGVVVGSLVTAIKDCVTLCLKRKQQRKLDNARKELLQTMLSDSKYQWRTLATLKHVIGADEATTIRLLLELKARGSEDGQAKWGLISRNPFPDRA